MGCFDQSFDIAIATAFAVELLGAILAIEIAFDKGWNRLWLECNSRLVVNAFNSSFEGPWKLSNRWPNFLSWGIYINRVGYLT